MAEKEHNQKENKRKLETLVEKLSEGQLTRRSFIKKGIALGFSVTFLMGITKVYAPKVFAEEDMPSDLLKKVKDEGSKVNVLNWSFYIDPGRVEKFQKEFNVKVTYDLFEDSGEMFAKISSGASGYDVAVNEQSYIKMLIDRGKLAPLNHDWLTNIGNLKDKFKSPPFDPGNKYSVAYQWGTTGFGHNTKFTKEDLRLRGYGSWSILFEGEKYKGKMTMQNDMGAVIGSALKYLGYSYNSEDEKELREAEEVLLHQKPWVRAYVAGPVRKMMIGEEVWLAHLWGGDVVHIGEKNEAVEYVTPKEGMELWYDNLTIPKDAPHKACAHLWINYFLRPQVIAAVSNYVHYASPNKASMPYIDDKDKKNPAVYAPDPILQRCEEELPYTGKALKLREKIWEKLKG